MREVVPTFHRLIRYETEVWEFLSGRFEKKLSPVTNFLLKLTYTSPP